MPDVLTVGTGTTGRHLQKVEDDEGVFKARHWIAT